MMSGISLDKLAQQLQGKIVASTDVASVLLNAVAALDAAGPTDVTFVSTEKRVLSAIDSDAGVIIVGQAFEQLGRTQLVV